MNASVWILIATVTLTPSGDKWAYAEDLRHYYASKEDCEIARHREFGDLIVGWTPQWAECRELTVSQ